MKLIWKLLPTTVLVIATLVFTSCNPLPKQQANNLRNETIEEADHMTNTVQTCATTLRVADKMPYFPGGQIELAKHLSELYKPILCAKGRLTKIGLSINQNGKVIGGIHRGFDGYCADRLNAQLSEMSNWVPGYNDGQPVCVQIEINIAQLLIGVN